MADEKRVQELEDKLAQATGRIDDLEKRVHSLERRVPSGRRYTADGGPITRSIDVPDDEKTGH
jgi:hypothetical protein